MEGPVLFLIRIRFSALLYFTLPLGGTLSSINSNEVMIVMEGGKEKGGWELVKLSSSCLLFHDLLKRFVG